MQNFTESRNEWADKDRQESNYSCSWRVITSYELDAVHTTLAVFFSVGLRYAKFCRYQPNYASTVVKSTEPTSAKVLAGGDARSQALERGIYAAGNPSSAPCAEEAFLIFETES